MLVSGRFCCFRPRLFFLFTVTNESPPGFRPVKRLPRAGEAAAPRRTHLSVLWTLENLALLSSSFCQQTDEVSETSVPQSVPRLSRWDCLRSGGFGCF